MAWQDRDYNQDGFGGSRGGFGGRLGSASVVTWLLGINCVIFLLDGVLSSGMRSQAVSPSYWGNFNVEQGVYGLQLWRFVTYQFLHDGLFHIFGNMLVLFFFGPMLEKWWGSRRFLAFYLLCGICATVFLIPITINVPGLIFNLAYLQGHGILPTQVTIVGASGSTFGILVGAAVLFPRERVMLIFPPIPMAMRTLALIFLGLAALSVIVGARNAGGEAAHLGGALLGFVLVKNPRWLNWADRFSASAIQDGVNKGRFERKRKREVADQAEVDRILDKVRDKGLGSLTRKEKKTLNDATERQKRAG